jgi:hypothetical protein
VETITQTGLYRHSKNILSVHRGARGAMAGQLRASLQRGRPAIVQLRRTSYRNRSALCARPHFMARCSRPQFDQHDVVLAHRLRQLHHAIAADFERLQLGLVECDCQPTCL